MFKYNLFIVINFNLTMSSFSFFVTFIAIIVSLLLFINIALAPSNPYLEKNSEFECGFHSFLGQNRVQFSISFFIFGLLFLLFDLEILLVYPYTISAYINDLYGLTVIVIFLLVLGLGFCFELGKEALKIDSKQNNENDENLIPTPHKYVLYINNNNII